MTAEGDPRLTELEIDVVTITRDGDGEIVVDGGGLTLESLVYLLRAADWIMMTGHFLEDYEEDDDDDDDDD